MTLDIFLIDIFQTGQVKMQREISEPDEETLRHSLALLSEYYRTDSLDMPFITPLFHADAALWAAKYIYRATQLILLRDIGEEQIKSLLVDELSANTPEEIYSADLMLRFLPDLFKLASGISPEDPLVSKLRETAKKWAFSSVGMDEIVVKAPAPVLANPTLRQAYIDRVICKKDFSRIHSEPEHTLLKQTLGIYSDQLLPNLPLALKQEMI
ncbi:hypothetical protein [Pedobacter helvus]|uniref:MoxR-vWA-beta-propeller ternary system domain-containing protein n=1 Tax=Pedobacter helvus TaxID=2563444 RepID=A0ABW9JJE6_9SPHI|nr:hypothetical protein [Pedobacter ureilyticus]